MYVGEGKADDPHDTEHLFEVVFSSPVDYTAVPLGLKFNGITPGENGGRKVAFTVFLQPNGFTTEDNWIKLNVHFVATDTKDKSILVFSKRFLAHLKPGAVTDLMQNGFSYNGDMNLSPGRYQMKLLVRDDLNAKFGSIQTPLLSRSAGLYGITRNVLLLVRTPRAVVTTTTPRVAPFGTVAVRNVSLITL